MTQRFTLTLTLMAAMAWGAAAQCTSTPPLLQENSDNIVVYYHADQGNLGLLNQPATAQIYAHTGVITNGSDGPSDWKYAPTWGDNAAKYKLEYVSPNLWKLDIGNIRSYYGITDPSVKVEKLAFVFRTGDKTAEGKGENGADIYLNVYGDGLQAALSSDAGNSGVLEQGKTVSFTLDCTNNASLSIAVNGSIIGSAEGSSSLTATYTFEQTGDYTVEGKAVYDGKTVTDTRNYTVPKKSEGADYPGGVPKMGAVRNADGSTTFCIAAPQKSGAMIVGSWNDYAISDSSTMYYQDYDGVRYFWIAIPGLQSATDYFYYYIIDGSIKVSDPYARLILDPSSDKYIPESVYPNLPAYPYDKVDGVPLAVYNDAADSYDWKVKDFKGVDKSQLVVYELLIRDFTGTEGKALGDGTIRGAMERLDYLQNLGVNAIELLPINEFNGNISWGYNPNFYFAPDKAYGTPDDYRAFIDECHSRGIAVILDMVFNQTDWQHPWYQMYPAGSNPFYNADAPHAYSVLNDWNQGYPLVEQQFKDAVQYWLTEYNVDGYRFDLVKGLGDNSSYANAGDAATNAYNQSRIDRMRRLQQAMEEVKPGAYFINENLAGAAEENAMAETGQLNWANINWQGQQFAAGNSSNSGLERFYAPLDSRTWGSTVSYLESHDEQRLAYVQNNDGVTGVRGNLRNSMHRLGSAAAQMLMAPGAHMIWQFSELGNFDNTKNANGGNNTDPKTVRWNLFDNANRRGLYESYRELIAIRKGNPELFEESAAVSDMCATANWAAGRRITLKAGGKELICIINPNVDKEITVDAPFNSQNNDDYWVVSKSYDTTPSFDASRGTVTVPANCYVVIGNKNISEVESLMADRDMLDAYAQGGTLTITGNAPVKVYDISGRIVYSGAPRALELPAGLYIVTDGAASLKVML